MIPVPYPFQDEAVGGVVGAIRDGARIVVLQSPTGSGKSTMGAMLVKRATLKAKQGLFIVHRRRLVDQFSERLFDFEVDHGILMRGHPHERDARIQVASRDTLLSRNEFELPPADFVIVDEGRHAISPEFRRLLAPYERDRKPIILLDATPVLSDGRGLGPWAQAMVVAAKVTDLVRDGYLVPVKCFAPDRKVVRGKVRRGIAGDLVESWQQYAEGMPTVLFCSRVQHSLDAVAAFIAAGIPAAHVDADTADDDRDRVFAGLEDGTVKVVSNVGIIKEGVDVPCLGCCQFYMDPPGRVSFLQGCGRIMRPFPGKTHGVLIDHAGAVFRHGFPDEDTDWTLDGNVDAAFAAKHAEGGTEKALFCASCNLMYHGSLACPQCGRAPAKPPRSIFAPPPVDATNEVLTEAERNAARSVFGRDEKIKHWLRCLATAFNRHGTFGMAAQMYKRKYDAWPEDGFPCMPARYQWKSPVADVFPNFGSKRHTA
jgi:DNA repair protein RadD